MSRYWYFYTGIGLETDPSSYTLISGNPVSACQGGKSLCAIYAMPNLITPIIPRAAEVATNGTLTSYIVQAKMIYGSPRITLELRKKSIRISRPRVARIMRKARLRSIVKKKFRITTDSSHKFPVPDNVLDRDFKPEILGAVWVSDITYIRTRQGWLYLTTVIDLGDRKIIG